MMLTPTKQKNGILCKCNTNQHFIKQFADSSISFRKFIDLVFVTFLGKNVKIECQIIFRIHRIDRVVNQVLTVGVIASISNINWGLLESLSSLRQVLHPPFFRWEGHFLNPWPQFLFQQPMITISNLV